jgi:hypothetical protein
MTITTVYLRTRNTGTLTTAHIRERGFPSHTESECRSSWPRPARCSRAPCTRCLVVTLPECVTTGDTHGLRWSGCGRDRGRAGLECTLCGHSSPRARQMVRLGTAEVKTPLDTGEFELLLENGVEAGMQLWALSTSGAPLVDPHRRLFPSFASDSSFLGHAQELEDRTVSSVVYAPNSEINSGRGTTRARPPRSPWHNQAPIARFSNTARPSASVRRQRACSGPRIPAPTGYMRSCTPALGAVAFRGRGRAIRPGDHDLRTRLCPLPGIDWRLGNGHALDRPEQGMHHVRSPMAVTLRCDPADPSLCAQQRGS